MERRLSDILQGEHIRMVKACGGRYDRIRIGRNECFMQNMEAPETGFRRWDEHPPQKKHKFLPQ
jgi:hypothetical protein